MSFTKPDVAGCACISIKISSHRGRMRVAHIEVLWQILVTELQLVPCKCTVWNVITPAQHKNVVLWESLGPLVSFYEIMAANSRYEKKRLQIILRSRRTDVPPTFKWVKHLSSNSFHVRPLSDRFRSNPMTYIWKQFSLLHLLEFNFAYSLSRLS